MTVSLPFVDYRATAVRPGWESLPEAVRAYITNRLGDVTSVAVAGAGFTPVFAATITTTDGVFFVKAAAIATEFGRAIRREAAVLAALPHGLAVPVLQWAAETHRWAILCLQALSGHMPGHPWTDVDLHAVLRAQAHIAEVLAVPSTALRQAVNDRSFAEHCREYFDTWRNVVGKAMPLPHGVPGWAQTHLDDLARLEALVPEATAYEQSIMHFDLRPDNVLIVDGEAIVLDWNWARPGPAAADTVMLLQTAHGHHNIDTLLSVCPTTRDVDGDVVDGILAAIGGFMMVAGQREQVAASPWLRAHQFGQGVRALSWLAERRGWVN